jgi:hypothetical protein
VEANGPRHPLLAYRGWLTEHYLSAPAKTTPAGEAALLAVALGEMRRRELDPHLVWLCLTGRRPTAPSAALRRPPALALEDLLRGRRREGLGRRWRGEPAPEREEDRVREYRTPGIKLGAGGA